MVVARSEIHMIVLDESEDDITVGATANSGASGCKTVVLVQGAARVAITGPPHYLDALFSSMANAAYEAGREEPVA